MKPILISEDAWRLLTNTKTKYMFKSYSDTILHGFSYTQPNVLHQYQCLICSHKFSTKGNKKNIFCPNCGCENINNLVEIQ